jgi:hypothetical protein
MAPMRNNPIKTVWTGMSTRLTGGPPGVHTIGAYGGLCWVYKKSVNNDSEKSATLQLKVAMRKMVLPLVVLHLEKP